MPTNEAIEPVADPSENASSAPSTEAAQETPRPDDELKNQLLRLGADFENYRKRSQREIDQARRFGIEKLLGDLLPVLDAVDRALEFVGDSHEPFAEGVRLIARQAADVLARHGVKGFASVGQPFDPTLHEAVGIDSAQGAAPGLVLQEHQRGYLLHDRLLRPARVIVSGSAKPSSAASE